MTAATTATKVPGAPDGKPDVPDVNVGAPEAGVQGGRRISPRASSLLAAGSGPEELLSGAVRRTVLPGGLRVVTEKVPGVRSAAIGVWVAVGSRDETPLTAGCSHYLEHLLFKGTPTRDALTISASVEEVGGEFNAFTAKEYTCYYARVLDSDVTMAIDVICDMVSNSLVTAEDVEAERGVILEEIAMHEDDPGDLVHDVFASAVLGPSALGRPVLGSTESIDSLDREAIFEYYRSRYVPPAMVVAIAGNIDHDQCLGLVAEAFAAHLDGPAEADHYREGSYEFPRSPGIEVSRRPTEQANLVLGTVGVSRHDPRRFTLGVLSSVLGGGMSSRLFQEIREKRGMAYSVYSFSSQYADTGLFGVYVGCAPKRADEVLALCREEIHQVADHGISPDEMARAKGQTRGSLHLGLEDTGSRMSRIGKSELIHGELLPVDEVIRRVEAVTLDEVRDLARAFVDQDWALGAIGPFDGHDFAAAVAR